MAAACKRSCLTVPCRIFFSPSRTTMACFLFSERLSMLSAFRSFSSSWCTAIRSEHQLLKIDRKSTWIVVGYSFNRFSNTSTAVIKTSVSIFGLGNLLFLAVFAHSSFGSSKRRVNETSSSGSSQSVRKMKTLLVQSVTLYSSPDFKNSTYSSSASSSHQSTRSWRSYLIFLDTTDTTRSARTSTTSPGLPVPDKGGRSGTMSTWPYRRRRSELGGSP